MIRRRKDGTVSERMSRSKEDWERGRGAKKKGNPSYKPVIRNGKKVYIVRPRNSESQKTSDNSVLSPLYRLLKKIK